MLDQYYQTLDLPRSATKAEVRKAFHQLLKVWHPDRYANDPALRLKAEQKTKDIICAYEGVMLFIINPDAYKKKYDKASSAKSPEIRPHFDTDFMARHNEAYARKMSAEAAARSRTRRSSFWREALEIPRLIVKVPFMIAEMIVQLVLFSRFSILIIAVCLVLFVQANQRFKIISARKLQRVVYEIQSLANPFDVFR